MVSMLATTAAPSTVGAVHKETDIGLLPLDWAVEPIEKFALITTGGRNTQDRVEDGAYPFFVRSQQIERINSYSFDGEAVLTAGDGVGTGKIFHYINGKCDIHQRVYRISDFRGDVGGYYFYLFFSTNFYNRIMQMTAKSSVDSVRREMIARMLVALPPKAEQEAIAEALSDADALIVALEALIAKKRAIKQGAMQDLLSGRKRLPGFNGEWSVKRLGDVGRCLRGVTYQPDRDLSAHDTANTKRLLRSNNVQEGVVNTSGLQFVSELKVTAAQILLIDDILVCMANGSKALVGKAGRFMTNDGFQYTFGAFMGCFRTDQTVADPGFVFSLFQTENYRGYLSVLLAGSSINNLAPGSIESLEFAFPPRPEQAAIAAVHSDMDTEIATLQVQRDKAWKIKQGMMQELLTGRVRLL